MFEKNKSSQTDCDVNIHICDGRIKVWSGDKNVGGMAFSKNPFHAENTYLRFDPKEFDLAYAAMLFERIADAFGPLQVMTYSDDQAMLALLKRGDFERKRRCYEAEFTKNDLIKRESASAVLCAESQSREYAAFCDSMYARYQHIHINVSPMTASLTEFCKRLPNTVYYAKNGCSNYAFVDGSDCICERRSAVVRRFCVWLVGADFG
ncbi:MAG: hypothetical protein PHX51_06240 [Clostridia bacterium]|nr:hypothetical protein [Clostridia bacterium]